MQLSDQPAINRSAPTAFTCSIKCSHRSSQSHSRLTKSTSFHQLCPWDPVFQTMGVLPLVCFHRSHLLDQVLPPVLSESFPTHKAYLVPPAVRLGSRLPGLFGLVANLGSFSPDSDTTYQLQLESSGCRCGLGGAMDKQMADWEWGRLT